MCRQLLAITGLAVALGCEGDGSRSFAPGVPEAGAAAPRGIAGRYAGSGVATLRTSSGIRKSYTCPGTLDLSTTPGNAAFSGSFAVQPTGDCDAETGTLAGTIAADGGVTFSADLPGGGSDVWQDGAERSGCRLVSSTQFTGTLAGDALSATGSAVYDCPTFLGTVRLFAELRVSATRGTGS